MKRDTIILTLILVVAFVTLIFSEPILSKILAFVGVVLISLVLFSENTNKNNTN